MGDKGAQVNIPISTMISKRKRVLISAMKNASAYEGALMVLKVGNLLHITEPGCQSALIIITPQKKRYSFTAGPKPSYSFRIGY